MLFRIIKKVSGTVSKKRFCGLVRRKSSGHASFNLCAGLFYYLCYSLIPRTFPFPSDSGTKLSMLEPSDEIDTGLMPLCGEKVCSNNNNCLLAINMIFNGKKVSPVLHSSSPVQ